jgi:hypothetical protein
MKQIDTCLDRVFEGKKPLKQKWQVIIQKKDNNLYLYHYQHLILVYDLDNERIEYEWYECPTDKRGLDAAKEYLEKRKKDLK